MVNALILIYLSSESCEKVVIEEQSRRVEKYNMSNNILFYFLFLNRATSKDE